MSMKSCYVQRIFCDRCNRWILWREYFYFININSKSFSYFCSKCGKSLDLLTQTYRPGGGTEDGANAPPPPRRDRGTSKYKSARKGRR